MLQNLRARRESYEQTKHLGLGDSSRQGAKSAKFRKQFSLRPLRPFGFAQDMLGAIKKKDCMIQSSCDRKCKIGNRKKDAEY
jgi:hypothetical protein